MGSARRSAPARRMPSRWNTVPCIRRAPARAARLAAEWKNHGLNQPPAPQMFLNDLALYQRSDVAFIVRYAGAETPFAGAVRGLARCAGSRPAPRESRVPGSPRGGRRRSIRPWRCATHSEFGKRLMRIPFSRIIIPDATLSGVRRFYEDPDRSRYGFGQSGG